MYMYHNNIITIYTYLYDFLKYTGKLNNIKCLFKLLEYSSYYRRCYNTLILSNNNKYYIVLYLRVIYVITLLHLGLGISTNKIKL